MNLTDNDKSLINSILKIFKEVEEKMEAAINDPVCKDIPKNYHKIFKLHYQRNRFVYDKLNEISSSAYKYLKDSNIIDHDLISLWKKNGYEKLCCLRCIQPVDSKHGNVCVCRVPKRHLEEVKEVECDNCGCLGCSGY